MSCPESIFRAFDAWEKRGRGWRVWPLPVPLEPPFRPFYGYRPAAQPCADTGRKHTFLSSLVSRLREKLDPDSREPAAAEASEPDEPEPQYLDGQPELAFFRASLPPDFGASKAAIEQFLAGSSPCAETSFEIIGSPGSVAVQFACPQKHKEELQERLEGYFPDGQFLEGDDALLAAWNASGEGGFIFEFGLSREFVIPFDAPAKFEPDPLIGIVGALSRLQSGEAAALQVLYRRAGEPWPASVGRLVTTEDGNPIFANAPEITKKAEKKLESPLLCAVLRAAIKAPSGERFRSIGQSIAGALAAVGTPSGNELFPLSNDGYEWDAHEGDFLARQSRRSGMILNASELSCFVHLPGADVKAPKLGREARASKAAPSFAQKNEFLLGVNAHAGRETDVSLSAEQRTRHMHVIGASGTGKSTLLLNLIAQDIAKGQGVGVLDPHGDLIDRILEIVPECRINDVVLIDPADEEYSVGFNILSAHSELEKMLLASDLVSVFERLSASWGDQLGSVFKNAVLAFLESRRGGNLHDLRRFLLEPKFREEFLTTVDDAEVQYYWKHAFPSLSGGKSVGSIVTRLETFLSPKAIRFMVTQAENRLDFADILDTGKIFLAKLSQGAIGRENAFLLGSLLMAKFQQAAMARQRQQADSRRCFWLYCDEFHNFITPSVAEILTGARKYRLGLTLAHQELGQLARDKEVAGAVMAAGSRVAFRVSDADARALKDGFASFEAADLQKLGTGEAVCRIERSDFDFNLKVPNSLPADAAAGSARRAQAVEASRTRYGTPRSSIRPQSVLAIPPVPEEQPAAKKSPPVPAVPAHQALKEQIAEYARGLGYAVHLEKVVLDGRGRVDVSLEKDGRKVACELSFTTSAAHEAGNARKCLEAGYQHVAVVCTEQKRLDEIRAATRAEPHFDRIGFYSPASFFVFLQAMEASHSGTAKTGLPTKNVRPFGAKLSDEERKLREQELLKMLAENMKKSFKR